MGLSNLFLLGFFGRTVPLGVDDGSPWTYVKAGATFLTEIRVYVKANLDFPLNGLFRTLFGTGATSGTIVTDAVGHGYKIEYCLLKIENCLKNQPFLKGFYP